MLPDDYYEPRQYSGVMVSGTFRDIEPLRSILIHAIKSHELTDVAMENDSAKTDVDVIDSSLRMVRNATAYIALIGRKYGQTPVCAIRNPAMVSLTELEFNEALRLNRPVLLFIMGSEYLLRARDIETDPRLIEKLDAFIERAKQFRPGSSVHRVYATFDTPAEFTEKVYAALADLRPRIPSSTSAAPEPDPIPIAPAFYAVSKYIPGNAFLGRKAELAILSDWAVASDQHPVLLFDAIGGSGKSMLTWQWSTLYAGNARSDWAGRFWYSFYERGAIMEDFCSHALAYMTTRPLDAFRKKKMPDLARLLLHQLNARPWLLILDGLERVLVEYHRIDAASVSDEEASNPSDQIAKRDPCSAIRTEDDDLLSAMAVAAPSKLLITSRLVPRALLSTAAHQPIPGVQRLPLLGLRPSDAEALFRSCGINGDSEAIQNYLKSHCDCHPLVTGVLAGIVGDYLPDRGNFDVWAADPAGGGQLNLATLNLVQKRNHILKTGLEALPAESRQLLSVLGLLSEAADYPILKALNPRLPAAPEEVDKPEDPNNIPWLKSMPAAERAWHQNRYDEGLLRWNQYQEALEAHRRSSAVAHAERDLGNDVSDLDRRGFLQYDPRSRRYDLHPVVRAIAVGGLLQSDKERLGQRVVDYFSQQTHVPYQQAETLEDLRGGLTVVRALLQMGRFQEAADAYLIKLCNPLLRNLEAYAEVLSIERPWFPRGWGVLPEGLPDSQAIHLTKDASSALVHTGQWDQSLAGNGAIITHCLRTGEWREVSISLVGVSLALEGMNRTAKMNQFVLLNLEIGGLALGVEDLFLRRQDAFTVLTWFGRFAAADEIWRVLDPMGRDWGLAFYRPGMAEAKYARFKLAQGILTNEYLSEVERIASHGKHLPTIREVKGLRGEWCLEQGEWELAATSLTEVVNMFRQSGQPSPRTEAMLALAKFHLRGIDDARSEAERLSGTGDPPHLHLSILWFGLGDRQRATTHALEAYRAAWADGEPYAYTRSLRGARSLLVELGAVIPELPAYDETRDLVFPWEDELKTAVVKLRKSPRRPGSRATPPRAVS